MLYAYNLFLFPFLSCCQEIVKARNKIHNKEWCFDHCSDWAGFPYYVVSIWCENEMMWISLEIARDFVRDSIKDQVCRIVSLISGKKIMKSLRGCLVLPASLCLIDASVAIHFIIMEHCNGTLYTLCFTLHCAYCIYSHDIFPHIMPMFSDGAPRLTMICYNHWDFSPGFSKSILRTKTDWRFYIGPGKTEKISEKS